MSKWQWAIPLAIVVGSCVTLSVLGDPPVVEEARKKRQQQRRQEREDAITAQMVARLERQFPELRDDYDEKK